MFVPLSLAFRNPPAGTIAPPTRCPLARCDDRSNRPLVHYTAISALGAAVQISLATMCRRTSTSRVCLPRLSRHSLARRRPQPCVAHLECKSSDDKDANGTPEQSSGEGSGTTELLHALQGRWEDNAGIIIFVENREVNFGDGSGIWRIEDGADGVLELRGTRFAGTADAPSWEFPNGVKRLWVRPKPRTPEEEAWSLRFHAYKEERLQLRKQIWASKSSGDAERCAAFQAKWDSGSVPTEGCSFEQQARLSAGRRLVPGVCFVHRRFGYRAVVIGCEPWCNASEAWKQMMGIDQLPRGELQPFYHCLVDERDRPGGQVTFVGEENIEPETTAYPVLSRLLPKLLVNCEEIAGYLPSPALDAALKRQRDGLPFDWML